MTTKYRKTLLKVLSFLCERWHIEKWEIVQVLVEEDPDILCAIDVLEG